MIKKIINSKYFTWYRKRYLENIHYQIIIERKSFCCHCKSIYSLFICWKNLKEVEENLNSEYLRKEIRECKSSQTCAHSWFMYRTYRINFLEECLNKFN